MWLVSGFVIVLLFVPCYFEDENFILSDTITSSQEAVETILAKAWPFFISKEFLGDDISHVYKNQIYRFPIVSTQLGRVRGTVTKSSRNQTPYTAFMGIPYAEPPIGLLRFQRPIPKLPWKGTLDATQEGRSCYIFRHPDRGSEDCLFLNVFTPITNFSSETPSKAVMVFIYGGAFIGGTSNTTGYAPDFLIDKDVVVVTFNYRVGPLGFLSLQNEDVPGNAGLKDQVVALKWVKENIKFFGGDSKRITIFGESAGAVSVMYHLISPSSRGLFSKVIAESGTPLVPWGYTDPEVAVTKAFELGRTVGCIYIENQKKELYECLLKTPPSLLTRQQEAALPLEELLKVRPLVFVPTSEPTTNDPFITKHPEEYLINGEFEQVPSIMGINSAEALAFYPIVEKIDPLGILAAVLSRDLTFFVPPDLKSTVGFYSPKLEQVLGAFYLRNKAIPMINLLNIVTDVQFLLPLMRTVKIMKNFTDIYLYLFTFEGNYNYEKQIEKIMDLHGVSHLDEVGYLLNVGPLRKFYNHENRDTPEEQVLDEITTLWTNFAKTGQPSTMWEPFREKDGNYLEITVPLQVKHHLARENVTLWNSIYENILNVRPF